MPKPAFTTVGNTSIATARLASGPEKPTLLRNSPSVVCTIASISGPDAALHGAAAQDTANSPTSRARRAARRLARIARISDPIRISSPPADFTPPSRNGNSALRAPTEPPSAGNGSPGEPEFVADGAIEA